eukprot:5386310-Pyramimonas_sp.AAC.1
MRTRRGPGRIHEIRAELCKLMLLPLCSSSDNRQRGQQRREAVGGARRRQRPHRRGALRPGVRR